MTVALDHRVALVRRIFIGGLSGFIAGFVVGGIGGRLAMRFTSLIDRSAHGVRTEGGFRVGEFTLEGTLGLVVFVGLFGGVAVTAVWPIIERWIPADGSSRTAVAAIAAIAIGGRMAIDGGNIDFRILRPGWLMGAIFVGLAASVGVVAVAVWRWLDRRISHRTFWAGAWPALVVLGALPAAGNVLLVFDSECACVSRPWLAGAFLILLGATTVVAWITEYRQRSIPMILERLGLVLFVGVIVTGLFHLGGEIAHFV